MSNNYQRITAQKPIPCNKDDYERLVMVMCSDEVEEHYNNAGYYGMDIIWDKDSLYCYADDFGDPNSLHNAELTLFSEIIAKAGLEFWEFGVAYWCDKARPDTTGGYKFRIYVDGSLRFPKELWEEVES